MWRSVVFSLSRTANVRFSSQFMRRRATKVLTAEQFREQERNEAGDEPDIIDLSHEFPANNTPKSKPKPVAAVTPSSRSHSTKPVKPFRKRLLRQETDPDLNETDLETKSDAVFDENGNIRYQKIGQNNTKVCLLMTQLKMRNYREKRGIMLLEGKRLIREALAAGMQMQYLIFSQLEDLDFFKDLMPANGCTIMKMFYRDIQIWSDLVTSPGLIAVFKIPNLAQKPIDESAIPVSVVCDSIREPGNLGSILRICTGGSCKRIFLLKGCADLWNIKVSRGASGVHFHSRISNNYDWDRVAKRIPANAKILIADTVSDSMACADRSQLPLVSYDEIALEAGANEIFLVIGGETEGVSDEAYALARKWNGCRVHIPLAARVQSLNSSTAFGIILFELRKALKRSLATNKSV